MKFFFFLLSFLLLSGCSANTKREEEHSPAPEGASAYDGHFIPQTSAFFSSKSLSPPQKEELPETPSVSEGIHPFIKTRLQEIALEISAPDMSEYDRTKAAFDYVLDHMTRGEGIGQELWRIHEDRAEPIPYLEQRALSPLYFGVGMCEDYAAALTLLLREMGLEAEYVPGLLYPVEGELADHAWTVVRIEGTWYHLDSHLEDYISRGRTVRYRYFLHGDSTFSLTHVWGQRLIDRRLLSPAQEAEIAEYYLTKTCPQDYPAPPQSRAMREVPPPDAAALQAQIEGEIAAYEQENGPLPEMELDVIPPVFGLEGYGPAD